MCGRSASYWNAILFGNAGHRANESTYKKNSSRMLTARWPTMSVSVRGMGCLKANRFEHVSSHGHQMSPPDGSLYNEVPFLGGQGLGGGSLYDEVQ